MKTARVAKLLFALAVLALMIGGCVKPKVPPVDEIAPPPKPAAEALAPPPEPVESVAPAAVQAPDAPSPDDVIAAYIEATGGEKAYRDNSDWHAKGTFAMPAMGLTAGFETWYQAPNRTYMLIESPALGRMESGSNGEVFWEKSMMTGARLKTGEEAAAAERETAFAKWLEWRGYYSDAVVTGRATVEDRECWTVVMTPEVGSPETHYFDVADGLLRKTDMAVETEMGRVTIEAFPGDYREQDGLTMSFSMRQVVMGMQEMTFTYDELSFQPQFPEGVFDLPEDVRILVTD